MNSTSLTVLVLAAAAGFAARSAFGHHSWSAEYDVSRSTSIRGTVARVMLRNPHSALILNVSTANGRQERWTVEWANPQRLRDRGVTERTLRAGDSVLVTGNPHRDSKVRQLRVLSVHRADDGAEIGAVSR
jgi:hypothetical protein